MKIYNSLTNKVEEFVPIKENEVSMYLCGPTVYNYPHVGNMRPVVVFDMMYRYFLYLGFTVNFVSNFTDVDDKIINSAIEKGISEKQLANKFIDAYLTEVKNFNCLDITCRPKVTEYMDEIINYIKNLIDKGFAYEKNNDVYFKIDKIKEYGVLSNQNVNSLIDGVRKNVDENKEESKDFILWKNTQKGIKWDSPFGEGRPGWHTECVVMIDEIFKDKIDIHGGGVDLKFPHHENEIAQSIASNDHMIANYWLHNGHINVDGKKMSKSLNNFVLSSELLEKFSANVIRLSMFKTHYAKPFNLADDLLTEAKDLDLKIENLIRKIKLNVSLHELDDKEYSKDIELIEIMDNDFNTANLISYLLKLVKDANILLRNFDKSLVDVYSKIKGVCFVLGLEYNYDLFKENDVDLYKKWLNFKENKMYNEADEVYKILLDRKIV